jgi:hypothetical protein
LTDPFFVLAQANVEIADAVDGVHVAGIVLGEDHVVFDRLLQLSLAHQLVGGLQHLGSIQGHLRSSLASAGGGWRRSAGGGGTARLPDGATMRERGISLVLAEPVGRVNRVEVLHHLVR